MRKETVNRAFIISRFVNRYPILADQVRRTMRRILRDEGHITGGQLMEEARQKAMEDQRRDGVHDPFEQESSLRWETRVIEHYRQLTDYYFARHHTLEDALEILEEIKIRHMDLPMEPDETETTAELTASLNRQVTNPRGGAPDTELLKVNLIRTLFSDELAFIGIAKRVFSLNDLQEIKARIIGTGRIGGKAAGLLLAYSMLRQARKADPDHAPDVRVPACYFIGSDVFYRFFEDNAAPFFRVQKYKHADEVAAEFPDIRNNIMKYRFPRDVIIKLRNLLNKFQGQPMIVRSSSLLEDNVRTSFAGKYESIFVANSGTPEENLVELVNAIKHVYASVFSPDVIAYRRERNLLDYDERMAILIQNVVGIHRGEWFAPTLAGVGFSVNPFRWSERIRERDGMLRLVLGLGTRAVGRVGNDYPRMVALTDPALRPEKNPGDILRYSQKFVDLLNLNTRKLTTLPLNKAVDTLTSGEQNMTLSVFKDGYITDSWFQVQPGDRFVPTLHGILKGPFPEQYRQLLTTLQEQWELPVDTEFAAIPGDNPKDLVIYLLQCRPLATGGQIGPVKLPEPNPADVVFTASGMTPAGIATGIRYLILIEPEAYRSLADESARRQVGQVVSRLNRALPKKTFVLMGPGRWGTVDVKLGVPVTYGDISRCAVLIELADGTSGYSSELSYGTHFYLDLVEAGIFPLSIQLDHPGNTLNTELLNALPNRLPDLVPDDADLADVIRAFDLTKDLGRNLSVYMSMRERRTLGLLEVP